MQLNLIPFPFGDINTDRDSAGFAIDFNPSCMGHHPYGMRASMRLNAYFAIVIKTGTQGMLKFISEKSHVVRAEEAGWVNVLLSVTIFTEKHITGILVRNNHLQIGVENNG
jgi:hypothetical protein